MTTLEAQLHENAAPRTQLAGLRLNYMHEMQAYQATAAIGFLLKSYPTASGCTSGSVCFRDVQEMMLERGIEVSYESVRLWRLKFGGEYARRL